MMHKPLFLCSVLIFSASFSLIASNSILVQSTTSTQNSGLFNYIVPIYQAKTGIEVKVVAVGTGQALKNAANGDADVVMVHAKSAEEIFIKNGYGIARRPLMYNQFFV
ncbi:MAG: sulfate transporter, partial [Proteobacteria bacterium]|nr:sulfate transporter [Pseudomonadota bacterium]